MKTAAAAPQDPPTHLASIAPLRVAPEELKAGPLKTQKGPADRIEPNRKLRIVKERDPIGARIDLHGLDQERAQAALEAFVLRAWDDGYRAVLVITGKGARGGGVLRKRAPEWLASPALRGVVSGFAPAARHHGGDGALYVTIRRG